ncbi:MAG TPA: glycosyl hydrolase [bacterium]
MKGLSRILLVFPLLAVPCLFDLSAQALFEPEDGVVYHGVGWGDEAQTNYCAMFAGDKQPLLFQNIFAIPGGARLLTVARILEALDPPNMHHEKQFAELSVHFMLGDETAVDSAFTFTGQYDSYIDTLAQALIQNGRPVFLRIGLEMNGPWNGYSPWIFPKAFRKLVLGLRARNVKDIVYVWCYEPDAESDFADSTERGWKWFPGDDAVDWFGLDLFDADHFNPDLSDSTGSRLTKKGRSTAFLRFAAERGKPVYLNELSARHVYISADRNDPDFDDGKRDWDAWFDPFFRFLALNPIIKAFN